LKKVSESNIEGICTPSIDFRDSKRVRMKPRVICLMAASVDGRTLPSRWRPKGAAGDIFERVHEELAGDAWLIGRVTGQEFAKGKPYPSSTKEIFPREPWFARRGAKAYGIVLDAHGKIAWGRADIGGDPIVVVLSEAVSDAHLAGLRSEGVSYIFAGKSQLDLALTLDILNRELGVKRLLLEGGGGANGAFLRAGLVDDFNLIVCPAVDGAKGAPSVFDSTEAETDHRAPVTAMTLESSRALEGGAMLLRYRIQNADPYATDR
jgi:riboflavin biosynthesis pyrimidine reductase